MPDNLTDVDNSIAAVTTNINTLEVAINTLVAAYANVKGQVATLQAQVSTLQTGPDYTPEVTGLVSINSGITNAIAQITTALS